MLYRACLGLCVFMCLCFRFCWCMFVYLCVRVRLCSRMCVCVFCVCVRDILSRAIILYILYSIQYIVDLIASYLFCMSHVNRARDLYIPIYQYI